MAVYTNFTKENIKSILSKYSIGNLDNFEGIQEGIENTNYLLLVDGKKYILTVYERRIK
jgi:homoserine kinase type II